jgi:hypothetical protein
VNSRPFRNQSIYQRPFKNEQQVMSSAAFFVPFCLTPLRLPFLGVVSFLQIPEFLLFFIFFVLYSTLLHLPPLRVRGADG